MNDPKHEPVAYTTDRELGQVRSGYYGRMQDDADDIGWIIPLYPASTIEALTAQLGALKEENERLNRLATDRRYMLHAYRCMLGPVALQVVEAWEKKGITRQHAYWGPEASDLTGEERAQSLLDFENAPSRAVDFLDGSHPTTRFDAPFEAALTQPQLPESGESVEGGE